MKVVTRTLLLAALPWVTDAFAATPAQIERGRQVYDYWCSTCHGAGPGNPGTNALRAKYESKLPAVLAERKDLTPEVVRVFVRQGIYVMPSFRKTEISDADLDAIGAYLARGESYR